MKNTRIPLDMIFIDENDEIVTIKSNATPHSLDIISTLAVDVQIFVQL